MHASDDLKGRASGGALRARLLASCALSGAGVMIVELTTTRLLAPWFGASIYCWTNVIAVVLLALALGYAVGGRLADRRPEAGFLGTLILVAALLLVPGPLLARFVAGAVTPKPELADPASGTLGVVLGSFVSTLLLFGPPLVILGAVTPFATRLLTDHGFPTGKAAGWALATSTLGSLVGTYLPALVLLELVGSRGTVFAAAGLLAIAGLLLLLKRPKTAAIGAAVAAVAIGGGATLLASTPVYPSTRGETVLAERESAYQYVRVARWPGKDREPPAVNLSLDEGILEFHSRKRDDPLTGAYYDFFAVLPDWIGRSDEDPLRVLILGGGAGTMRGMLRSLQGPRIDRIVDVELDPAVAAFAPEFGGPPAGRDQVLIADGRVALERQRGPFDLVILDAYARQIAIPAHLATLEAFRAVKDRLSPRGIFAVNVSTLDVEAPLCAALSSTMRAVFGRVWSIAIKGHWNVLLIAGDLLPPERAKPARNDALDPVRVAFRQSFHELPAVPDGRILTDDCAPLESLARRIR